MNEHNVSKGLLQPNRLITEKSPYLLQHAYNPVDWYPWGDEAFAKAKKENMPVFLSIGYSSCHWCHVLAHESFEDKDVADYLNKNFVCVKVDREERPDVDEIYMKAVMSMTGSGGWPLSLFLTPNLEPIFGGTYFPPTPRHGMPSFINVARGVAGSWKKERKNVIESARQVKESLAQMYLVTSSSVAPNDTLLEECYSSLVGAFDDANGGFGDSPKFPMPSNLFFLMRYYDSKRSKLALNMVTRTLDAMLRGGIYDHVGGGFHRYSTDRYWLVPHFEKMLYDNALLAMAYIEAFIVTKEEIYAKVARETLSWAMREMRSKEGGFYSSQDADSLDGEGLFYVWTPAEVLQALKDTSSRSDVVLSYFSVTNEGNFAGGKSILTAKQIETVAKEFELNTNELQKVIEDAKKIMLAYRSNRSRPATDDKIITSWNGLMISALSKAYNALGNESYLTGAIAAAELILTQIKEGNGQALPRSCQSGEARGSAVLEDYSFFINGLIDLYEASFDPKYLKNAISICETMISKFQDQAGAFFFSDMKTKNLIVRAKDGYDGALPSGNSMAALVLARLSEFTTRDDLRKASREVFDVFCDAIERQPSSFTQMLVAFQFLWDKPKEIVISGDPNSGETMGLVRALRSRFLPNSVTLIAEKETESLSPLVKGRIPSQSDRPQVFVCSNFNCHLPIRSPEELNVVLEVRPSQANNQ